MNNVSFPFCTGVSYSLLVLSRKNWRNYVHFSWKISGRQKDKAGHAMTVELEVVVVENMGKVN